MLNIIPLSNNIVNFKQNNYQERPVVYKTYKTEATTGKKWGVGIASWILPGVGQAINNEWGKGIGFFALSNIAPIITSFLSLGGIYAFANKTKAATGAAMAGLAATWLMLLGGRIWACVDAVKNAKSEIEVPVRVQQ